MNGKELFAAIDAVLNGLSGLLLLAAYIAIRMRHVRVHVTLMITALATSAIFLACYLYSKFAFGEQSSGLQPGPLKTAYLILLASHVLLAIGMLPPIFVTVWRAAHGRWHAHKRIARPTIAIWFYVSVTGVIVYWLLYHYIPKSK